MDSNGSDRTITQQMLTNLNLFYSKVSTLHNNEIILYSDSILCHRLQPLSFSQSIGKKILLIGESNTGKTEITSKFLSYSQSTTKFKKIYVFDMGPERFHIKDTSFGGKLSDYDNSYQMDSKVTNFSFKIIPPRSSSTTQMEVYQNCVKNYQIINKDFRTVIQQLNHSQIHETVLIINDFSIFLHLGSHIPLLKILKSHLTVFVNAYYGQKLADDFGSQISWREKVLVQLLSRHFDYSIYLVK